MVDIVTIQTKMPCLYPCLLAYNFELDGSVIRSYKANIFQDRDCSHTQQGVLLLVTLPGAPPLSIAAVTARSETEAYILNLKSKQSHIFILFESVLM